MELVQFHPIDYRLEAAAVLTRLAYRGDDVRNGDLRPSAEHYSKKYGIDIGRFSGMIEAYEYVKANFACDESELLALFAFPEGMETNINDLLTQLRFNLGETRLKDLNMRIALFLSDEKDEPIFEHAGVADLMAYAERIPISDSARWLLSDAIIRYDAYAARANCLLDQAERLIREKSFLLEPYAEQALNDWRALSNDEAFFDRLAKNGVRLDCFRADVYPLVFLFTSISLHSNVLCAEQFGEEERTAISYGVWIDEINLSERSGRDDLESISGVLHALDDKKRLQILVALRTRPLYGQELANVTGLSPATVSHHMSELAGSGLVTIEKQGVKLLYQLNEPRLKEFTAQIEKNLLR
ncbi:MAG: metalloregulator ArsR/SmtB family transcription factor [Eubacteriales bacterium]|nr:metalloregulator ArsR/SmtB family transcription factor [Eubacteriales bacterium]